MVRPEDGEERADSIRAQFVLLLIEAVRMRYQLSQPRPWQVPAGRVTRSVAAQDRQSTSKRKGNASPSKTIAAIDRREIRLKE
jgi:hypothetical protein